MMKRKATRACTRDYNSLVSCKRSQEEIVGFVLIIVLVSIIAVIFLAINIHKKSTALPSAEVDNFLLSASKYSADCHIDNTGKNIMDLVDLCYSHQDCQEGASCSILNQTLNGMINEAWKPGIRVSGVKVKVYEEKTNSSFLELKIGNFSGSSVGGFIPIIRNDVTMDIYMEVYI